MFFEGKVTWIWQLQTKRERAEQILAEKRIYFQGKLQKEREKIFNTYDILASDMDRFNYYCKLSECEQYNISAKKIIDKARALLEEAYQLNYHEDVIQIELTNIQSSFLRFIMVFYVEIIKSYEHFLNHGKLWEYIAEKWKL